MAGRCQFCSTPAVGQKCYPGVQELVQRDEEVRQASRQAEHKRRSHRNSAKFTHAANFEIQIDGCSNWGFVYLPKIGDVKFRLDGRELRDVSSVTLIQEPSGKYYLAFVTEHDPEPVEQPDRVSGIDLGLTDLASIVSSDGTRMKIPNPRHLKKAQRKLRKADQDLSRKKRGSSNWKKSRIRRARAFEKVRLCRKDFLDKLSRWLVDNNHVLCLETLAPSNMMKNRKLAKAIADAGWGILVRMLTYKMEWAGGEIVFIDRFYPSTKTCSVCVVVSGDKPLNVRVWTCECGAVLDRDFNAAVNIVDAAGHAESLNACGGDVRRRLSAYATSGEAGTHRRTSVLQ